MRFSQPAVPLFWAKSGDDNTSPPIHNPRSLYTRRERRTELQLDRQCLHFRRLLGDHFHLPTEQHARTSSHDQLPHCSDQLSDSQQRPKQNHFRLQRSDGLSYRPSRKSFGECKLDTNRVLCNGLESVQFGREVGAVEERLFHLDLPSARVVICSGVPQDHPRILQVLHQTSNLQRLFDLLRRQAEVAQFV